MKNSDLSKQVSIANGVGSAFFSSTPPLMNSGVTRRMAGGETKRFNLSQRIRQLLNITRWSETSEGDQEYFGF